LRQGYYIYLGCRDIKKGELAVNQLKSEGLNEVEPIKLTLTMPDQLKPQLNCLLKKTKTIDVFN